MMDQNLLKQRIVIGRFVYCFFLLTIISRYALNATPSNFLQPVLFRYNFDYTYWLFDIAGLFELIVESKIGSIIFDLLLFSSCILCIIFPGKNLFSIIFGCLYFSYAIVFNTYILHHAHSLALMTLITIPFFFKNHAQWKLLWKGMRFYVCYAYAISFYWKVFVGKSFFYWPMGENSTKGNVVQYLYQFPHTYTTAVYKFFLDHPALLNLGFIIICLLEGIMIIGFFTKRFDHLLILCILVIHISTYFFSDAFFLEMLVGIFTFITFNTKKANIISSKSFYPVTGKD